MSAAERARLGVNAWALLAAGPIAPRAAALGRALAGTPRAATPVEAVAATPDWLRLDAASRRRLGRRAALGLIAPRLATTIDGDWLRGLARVAGEADLDWAMQRATPSPASLPHFDGPALDGVANAVLAAATPPPLRAFLETGAAVTIDPAAAATAVAAAHAGP